MAKTGADLATGELMTPVIGSLSKGNAIASDMGVLEGKLNNVSKGNVGGKVVEGSSKAEGTGIEIINPILENSRTGSALKTDAQHAFNDIIDNYAGQAKKFPLKGGDGINRDLFQIEGSLNGKNGVFEWIIDLIEGVTHRRFIEGVGVKGKPNARK